MNNCLFTNSTGSVLVSIVIQGSNCLQTSYITSS